MFYSEIVTILRATPDVANTVATFENEPAVFSNEAPESAEKPYIIIRIETSPLVDNVVSSGNLYIDYYAFNESRITADSAVIAVESLLDTNKIRTENLTDIRFSLINEGYLPESDPRSIHHNSTFSFRAARSGWMKRTKI